MSRKKTYYKTSLLKGTDADPYQCHSVNRLLIKTVYHNLPIIENTVQLVTP